MPKIAKQLTDTQVKKLGKKPGRHPVGAVAGLHLHVRDGGGSQWVLRTMVHGKRRDLSLGSFATMGLADARDRARAIKADIDLGIDPQQQKKAIVAAKRLEDAKALTFAEASKQAHEVRRDEFAARHADNWIRSLEIHAYPIIGELPIGDIETEHVLKVLTPIWRTRTDTASRVRQRIEQVFTWARVAGFYKGQNPAQWKGLLDQLLPNPSKIHKVKHYPSLPWQEMPAFIKRLRQIEGQGARALEFAIFTAARSGTVRKSTPDEIEGSTWVAPASHMKSGKAWRYPLSPSALKLIQGTENQPLLFPSKTMTALSDMTLSAVCKRMEVDAVPHGFRTTFKDWTRECTDYSDEASELALAHDENTSARAAYARSDLLDIRRAMMDEWAAFLESGGASDED